MSKTFSNMLTVDLILTLESYESNIKGLSQTLVAIPDDANYYFSGKVIMQKMQRITKLKQEIETEIKRRSE